MNTLEKIRLINPVLLPNTVYVFLIRLDSFFGAELIENLSQDEKDRANKFKIEQKRDQFIITRSLLRQLLANSLDKLAEEIVFSYAEQGKPYLQEKYNNKQLMFNVSHSGHYAVIALGLEQQLGVDIEMINTDIDYQSLVKRFFSQQEQQDFSALNEDEKLTGFYQIWSRKESFIKATGQGVAFGLDCFSVPMSLQNNKVTVDEVAKIDRDWYLYEIATAAAYKAALTTDSNQIEIVMSQLI